jgi:2-keto-4-pentenoate hydratase/2-oxohepta-3-ene-1,7-dioic acid hydratase in catechol pathway
MRLLTYRDNDRTAVGVLKDGWVIDAAAACALVSLPQPPATMRELIEAGPTVVEHLRRGAGEAGVRLKRDASGLQAAGAAFREDDVRILAPVLPSKIIAIGLNYAKHAAEGGREAPKVPLIFGKYPTTVIGPGDTIEYSTKITTQVDFEAELAVVIGRPAKNVAEDDALSYVFGYTCGNDVSARDLQKGDGQWTRAKGLDTFCPLGPAIVTADEVPDPQTLPIRSVLNGTVMQDSTTSDMIFSVKHLIAYASAAFTLLPGDIIMTGTPEGVGIWRDPPVLMQDGDRIRIEIDGIGAIENPVRVVG